METPTRNNEQRWTEQIHRILPFCVRYQIYATMASFWVPLCVMVVVYVKILRVVADKKKTMTWKKTSPCTPSSQSTCHNVNSNSTKSYQNSATVYGKSSSQAKLIHGNKNANASLVPNSISPASSLLKKGDSGLPPQEHLSSLNPGVSSTANTLNGTGTYLIPSITTQRVKKGEEFFYSSILQIKLYSSKRGTHKIFIKFLALLKQILFELRIQVFIFRIKCISTTSAHRL